MWGVSGALNLQSALARQNTFCGNFVLSRRYDRCVEIKVLCNDRLWTMSGSEGSSIKQLLSCAIRKLWWSICHIRSLRADFQERLHSFFLIFWSHFWPLFCFENRNLRAFCQSVTKILAKPLQQHIWFATFDALWATIFNGLVRKNGAVCFVFAKFVRFHRPSSFFLNAKHKTAKIKNCNKYWNTICRFDKKNHLKNSFSKTLKSFKWYCLCFFENFFSTLFCKDTSLHWVANQRQNNPHKVATQNLQTQFLHRFLLFLYIL